MEPDLELPVSLGTTIMAVSYDGGVILGADSRTSTGNYIANRVTDKLTPLSDNVYLCRSGSAADTQAIAGYVQYFIAQHQTEKGAPVEVRTAANLIMQMAYGNKNNLQAGMIVAGFDSRHGGQVYAIPLGGTLVQVPFTAGGSGSAYITGFLDKNFKPNMTEAEAHSFVVRAVAHAMSRDASSGGCIRTMTINKDGCKRAFIKATEIPLTYDELPTLPRR